MQETRVVSDGEDGGVEVVGGITMATVAPWC